MKMQNSERKSKALVCVILAMLLSVSNFGCKNIKPDATQNELQGLPATETRYEPGDEIEVKFFYNPELDELQMIRPDGKITLQLVGDLQAAGKTPSELGKDIQEAYAEQLRDPAVAVMTRTLATRHVFVGGAVKNAGIFEMPGSMTAMEAVMRAGGWNPFSGDIQQVIVIRNRNGEIIGCKLDLREPFHGKQQQAFNLEPKDIVYVPTTAIADANNWVEQYINRLLPRFGLSYGADGNWYMSR